MKSHLCMLLLMQFVPILCFSQSALPAYSTANWRDVGALDIPVLTDSVQVNINDYGGDPSGAGDNSTALSSAIAYLQSTNKTGIVYFGTGTYTFTATAYLTNNIILKGAGAASTTLRFVMGGTGDLVSINGSFDNSTTTTLIGNAEKNQYKVRVASPATFNIGDMVKLMETDTDLMTSTWAYNNVGQILQVKSIVGDSLEFYSAMHLQYPATRNPYLVKLNMASNVGISCLKIVRGDNVTNSGQYSNILMNAASNCWVNGVESDSTYFAHVTLNNCYHTVIKGSYFTKSYDYGGDGRAYGIACQNSSSENLIIDNIFQMVRHAMLLQAGANGNVFAYNYSRDTYWTGTALPGDASGDIVVHGNYPFSNLFEGNIVQNLELDNSHGINGPYNLFFRNRAENVGIYMNSGAGDSSAFIGNEVTTSASKASSYFGLVYGQYAITGNGNFAYGNNIRGTNKPTGTTAIAENSYYLTSQPSFFTGAWPGIGYPNTLNSGTIPAKARYDASPAAATNYPVCSQTGSTVLALDGIVLSGQSLSANTNKLSWKMNATDDELVCKILRSLDGVHFDTVGQKIQAASTVESINTYIDELDNAARYATNSYYCVVSYVHGELEAISNICVVKNMLATSQETVLYVTVYPNPTAGEVSAIFYYAGGKALSANIIDQSGKTVYGTQVKTTGGWNKIKFSLAALPAGLYHLAIQVDGTKTSYPIFKK